MMYLYTQAFPVVLHHHHEKNILWRATAPRRRMKSIWNSHPNKSKAIWIKLLWVFFGAVLMHQRITDNNLILFLLWGFLRCVFQEIFPVLFSLGWNRYLSFCLYICPLLGHVLYMIIIVITIYYWIYHNII